MPQNVQPANPTTVMPQSLSASFTEEETIESLVNTYMTGFSTRAALAINPRRFWKLSKYLTADQWQTLRNFYEANLANAFWFYNPRETVPPFSYDPSGAATQGRYAVVFDGGWTEEIQLPRMSATFGLREVA